MGGAGKGWNKGRLTLSEIEIHPMEWRQYGHMKNAEWSGRPPLRYVVTEHPWGAALTLNGSPVKSADTDGYWPSADAAKSAAIQDLEERVSEVARAI